MSNMEELPLVLFHANSMLYHCHYYPNRTRCLFGHSLYLSTPLIHRKHHWRMTRTLEIRYPLGCQSVERCRNSGDFSEALCQSDEILSSRRIGQCRWIVIDAS